MAFNVADQVIMAGGLNAAFGWSAGAVAVITAVVAAVLAISGLVYWVLSRSLDLTAEKTAIEASDQELAALQG